MSEEKWRGVHPIWVVVILLQGYFIGMQWSDVRKLQVRIEIIESALEIPK